MLRYLACYSVLTSSRDIFTVTYRDELLFLLILYDTSLNFYSQRHCWFATQSMKLFEVVSSTTPFTSPTKFAHSSSACRARGENTFVLPSFRDSGEGSVLLNVRPRRGTSLPGIVQRTAAASRSRGRRGSNDERIFQLAAPAEMRRLCLSINMRRDKATRSFIRSRRCSEWVSGSSGLGPTRYVLSFITMFHAHFSSCLQQYTRCCSYSPT